MSSSGSSSNLIPVVRCMLFFIVILLFSGLKKKKVQYLISLLRQRWFLEYFDELLTCSFKIIFFLFWNWDVMDNLLQWSEMIGFRGMLQIAFLPLLPCKTMYICSYIWLLI